MSKTEKGDNSVMDLEPLRVHTHIVIKQKFIFSYNDFDIQIHIFSLLLSA